MNDDTQVPAWVRLTSNAAFLVAIIAAVGFVAYAGGCTAMRDGVSWLIGAPTSKDYKAAEEKLDTAERQADEAERKARDLELAITKSESDAADAEARKAQIRTMYANAAAQMADLTGSAADAMIGVMDQLQNELRKAKDEADAAANVVTAFQVKVAEYLSAAEQARERARVHVAELEGLDEQAAFAVASATDSVKLAGTMAQTFGVPGGQAMGNQAGEMVGGLLGLLGIGGAGVASWRARRERKRADAESSEADWMRDVIVMTEKMGLIRTDADAERAKAVARSELGDATIAKMNALTGTVRKPKPTTT